MAAPATASDREHAAVRVSRGVATREAAGGRVPIPSTAVVSPFERDAP